MAKRQQGVEGAAERLRALLAQVEAALAALTAEVEADEREDQGEIRGRLAELHQQAVALVARAEELLERAREVAGAADAAAQQKVDNTSEFVEAFEELVAGLESAADTIDPGNWNWGDEGNGG